MSCRTARAQCFDFAFGSGLVLGVSLQVLYSFCRRPPLARARIVILSAAVAHQYMALRHPLGRTCCQRQGPTMSKHIHSILS